MREAHDGAIVRFSDAGTWLDGPTRRAVVREARNARTCGLCGDRRESLSWAAVKGGHETSTSLSAPLVELAHRLNTDSGRVADDWFESLMEQGISREEYVEAVGLVGTSTITDTFANTINGRLAALPDAGNGVPAREQNPGVVEAGARVPLMDPENPLAPFGEQTGGQPTPNIVRALAMVPASLREFWSAFTPHYRPRDTDDRGLHRSQIELVASRTSALNECFY